MKHFLVKMLAIVTFALIVVACNPPINDEPPFKPENYSVSGKVEKGPFVSGSTITMQLLDDEMQPTGDMYNTTILDDEGSFTFGSKMFNTPYADLSANGYFFNEVRGGLSSGTLNLRAIVDISDATTINVNVLTHIKYQRVLNLVKSGKSFKNANTQAQQELFGSFGCSQYADIEASRLSIISGDEKAGVLIAISSLLLVERSEAELTEYLARLCREFAADGKFSNATQEIIRHDLDNLAGRLEEIGNNIVNRYAELGMSVVVPELKKYFDWDGDGVAGEEGYIYDVPGTEIGGEVLLQNLYSDVYSEAGFPLLGSDGSMMVAAMAMDLANSLSLFNVVQQFYHYNKEVGNLVSQNIQSNHSSIADMWGSFYKSVQKNLLLRHADMQMKNVYEGQCNFFAAMQYYYMTTIWGDVPYIETYGSSTMDMGRSNAREILEKQKDLLRMAMEAYLEEKKNESMNGADGLFFASKDAARVLLAEMMLSLGDYAMAREMLDLVINMGFYSLTDANFSNIETLHNIAIGNECNELIFALYAAENNTRSDVTIQGIPVIPIQTLTEVMLLYAEANYLMGDWERANRTLENLAAAKGITLNTDNILQAITDARKQLLLYSLGNFAYMKRNGLFMEEYGVSEQYQLLPIPRSELDYNPLMTQNPGY